MSDPFQPESNQQLMREARVGLTILAITLGLFVYVAYHRISGQGTQLPDHVINAPIAERVWPNGGNPNPSEDSFAKAQTQLVNAKNSPPNIPTGNDDFHDPLPEKTAIARLPDDAAIPRASEDLKTAMALQKELRDQIRELKTLAQNQRQNISKPKLPPLDINGLRKSDEPKLINKDRTEPVLGGFSKMPVVVTSDAENVPLVQHPNSELSPADNEFQSQPISAQAVTNNASVSNIASSWPESPLKTEATSTGFESASEQSPPPKDVVNPEFDTDPIPAVTTMSNRNPAFADAASSYRDTNLKTPVQEQPTTQTVLTDAQPTKYAVQTADSFWSISQKIYGDGRYFRALFKHNEKTLGRFENLVAGTTLQTPSLEDLKRLWPDECPHDAKSAAQIQNAERTYTTRKGDTLFEIARQRLGQASRYLDILKMNETRLPAQTTHLTPLPDNLRLMIPAK